MADLPTLASKALIDCGYDLQDDADEGWVRARVAGAGTIGILVRDSIHGILLAVPESGVANRIGLAATNISVPPGMRSIGIADSEASLLRSLQVLRALQANPEIRLSAELEARLSRIPATERTREVRERIGQDLFRGALFEFWDGRCALSGMALPPALLRASHAVPWADASDAERLDPFNGLLLAVQYDVLFDKYLIAFDDSGALLISSTLRPEVRTFLGLHESMRLRFVLPGHLGYLRRQRERFARGRGDQIESLR